MSRETLGLPVPEKLLRTRSFGFHLFTFSFIEGSTIKPFFGAGIRDPVIPSLNLSGSDPRGAQRMGRQIVRNSGLVRANAMLKAQTVNNFFASAGKREFFKVRVKPYAGWSSGVSRRFTDEAATKTPLCLWCLSATRGGPGLTGTKTASGTWCVGGYAVMLACLELGALHAQLGAGARMWRANRRVSRSHIPFVRGSSLGRTDHPTKHPCCRLGNSRNSTHFPQIGTDNPMAAPCLPCAALGPGCGLSRHLRRPLSRAVVF